MHPAEPRRSSHQVTFAVLAVGVIAFGLLQVPNVAHPTFVVLGAYCAYFGNLIGIDPVLAGVLFAPVFYLSGAGKEGVIDLREDAEENRAVREFSREDGGAVPRQADEFVCQSCFLVKHHRQLVDTDRSFCRDCACFDNCP